ncbi:LptF/LptG family permease [uncultured Campylobacter sp.]|uniref:LptF/LptG family permease n=1 Tax=uncultured Campylobacter sp. TaxID=218934 RepID=UPI0026210569|nr:LptF/LptG family permease [uncultured Campylobacter sp.]
MASINRYLLSNFLYSFIPLFGTLFLIVSIIFFMLIARVTAFIEIDFYELLQLYLFYMPRVFIFTMPISFFIAVGISLFKLSKESEIIVLFTLGYNPSKIKNLFLSIAFFISLFLLFCGMIIVPIAQNLKENFFDYKKTKAVINIKTGEFGQKFANWLVYIESEKDDIYKDIFMYSPKDSNKDERIITAREGSVTNRAGYFVLELKSGKIYTNQKNSWHITKFSKLSISSTSNVEIKNPLSIKEYWQNVLNSKNGKQEFTIYVLASLFPLAGTLFAIGLGIVVYRYQQNGIYLGLFAVLFSYYAILMLLANKPFIALPTIFFGFGLLSMLFYHFRIVKKF